MCFSAAPGAKEEAVGRVLALLEPLGRVERMEDGLIDAATAVMGCSPAYLAVVAGEIARAGAAGGLDPELSSSLMVDTMAATAELLRSRTPQELIAEVASPGGSTEAGLEALEREGARAAFGAAVAASLARMRGDG
jgi:pyrroline-5-carboxylate reductase